MELLMRFIEQEWSSKMLSGQKKHSFFISKTLLYYFLFFFVDNSIWNFHVMISLIIRDLVLSRRIVLPTLSFFADLLKFLKHPNVKFKFIWVLLVHFVKKIPLFFLELWYIKYKKGMNLTFSFTRKFLFRMLNPLLLIMTSCFLNFAQKECQINWHFYIILKWRLESCNSPL